MANILNPVYRIIDRGTDQNKGQMIESAQKLCSIMQKDEQAAKTAARVFRHRLKRRDGTLFSTLKLLGEVIPNCGEFFKKYLNCTKFIFCFTGIFYGEDVSFSVKEELFKVLSLWDKDDITGVEEWQAFYMAICVERTLSGILHLEDKEQAIKLGAGNNVSNTEKNSHNINQDNPTRKEKVSSIHYDQLRSFMTRSTSLRENSHTRKNPASEEILEAQTLVECLNRSACSIDPFNRNTILVTEEKCRGCGELGGKLSNYLTSEMMLSTRESDEILEHIENLKLAVTSVNDMLLALKEIETSTSAQPANLIYGEYTDDSLKEEANKRRSLNIMQNIVLKKVDSNACPGNQIFGFPEIDSDIFTSSNFSDNSTNFDDINLSSQMER